MSLVKSEVIVCTQSGEDFSEDNFIVDGVKLKCNNTPKLLDIFLDEKLTFGPHIANTELKNSKALKVIREKRPS